MGKAHWPPLGGGTEGGIAGGVIGSGEQEAPAQRPGDWGWESGAVPVRLWRSSSVMVELA
jgi:hypothetical protein